MSELETKNEHQKKIFDLIVILSDLFHEDTEGKNGRNLEDLIKSIEYRAKTQDKNIQFTRNRIDIIGSYLVRLGLITDNTYLTPQILAEKLKILHELAKNSDRLNPHTDNFFTTLLNTFDQNEAEQLRSFVYQIVETAQLRY